MKLKSGRQVDVIGHRGVAAEYPENTIVSFRAAFNEHHADMVEFDVLLTKDLIPVILHDATLNRTTNGRGKLSRILYPQLKSFDAGFHFNPQRLSSPPFKGRGLSIPRFEELLNAFPDKKLFIELKASSQELIHRVMKLVYKNKAEQRVIMTSKYHLVFKTMASDYPNIPRALSHAVIRQAYRAFKRRDTSYQFPFGPTVASLPLRAYRLSLDHPGWIQFLTDRGVPIYYWTINDPKEAVRLIRAGASGVISDNPGLIRQALLRLV